METKDYLKDIQDIKTMMAQSSQFISLSGFSGIIAGVYALIGAFVANLLIENNTSQYVTLESSTFKNLIITAAIVLILSIVTAYIFTVRKAKKMKEKVWNPTSKRLVINFAIPLATGGFFILFLIEKEMLGLVAPLTLIFYGLACVNASKYTLGDVRYLGVTMILLGLLSTWFLGYGLLFWALGFGVCHILYGSIMYFKHDRN